jgi:hypothetical protein
MATAEYSTHLGKLAAAGYNSKNRHRRSRAGERESISDRPY